MSEGCRGGESCVWDGDRPRVSAQEVTRNLRPEGRSGLALRGRGSGKWTQSPQCGEAWGVPDPQSRERRERGPQEAEREPGNTARSLDLTLQQ